MLTERERDRERERERDTETQRDTERETETDRQTERESYIGLHHIMTYSLNLNSFLVTLSTSMIQFILLPSDP